MIESPRPLAARLLAPLASLRLTVALLAMAIFIVFAGTVAQIDKGIWTVLDENFRCFVAWIPLKIFFPRDWNVPAWRFPFPGGWLIGSLLLANLLAAHAGRFTIVARGRALWGGAALLAAGAALCAYVISNVLGEGAPGAPVSPAWRVTCQLLEGGGAAAVLLAGCALLFRRRAGIVLLHAGVVLMMVNELWAGLFAVEGRMTIDEGQTVSFVEDPRRAELAIVDPSDPRFDDVAVVPESRLRRDSRVHDALLPFDVEVVTFMPNSDLERPRAGESNPATAGAGLEWVAIRRDPVSGVDPSQRADLPSAYVTFRDSKSGAALGTYLVSAALARGQTVPFGGKAYDVALRFARTYKPYAIELIDFRFDKYVGTSTPRNFSSDVRLIDPERGVDRRARIWMNNPLRYRGETFYQASFKPDESGTVLQVVRNAGWMVPYVGCMIVATGLLAHFGMSIVSFLRHRRAA